MSSPYTLILADVLTLAAQVQGFEGSNRRVCRKEIIKLEGDELPLMIAIREDESGREEGMEGALTVWRGVGVALLFAGNQNLETGSPEQDDAEDDMRQKLYVASLPTATSVRDSKLILGAAYDRSAIAANIDVRFFRVVYRSEEDRNS